MTQLDTASVSMVSEFSAQIYNALRDVDIVDSHLDATDFFGTDFVFLSGLFHRYEVQGFAGICLLHKHSLVDRNEVMVQVLAKAADGDDQLVTSPMTRTDQGYAAAKPWSFMARSDSSVSCLRPIEYALDRCVLSDYSTLMENPEFLREFAEYVTLRSLNAHIGLALIRRVFPAGPEGTILLEEIDESRRHNTRRFVDERVLNGRKTIQTVYPLEELDVIEPACTPVCVPIARCLDLSPGHGRETSHEGQHGHSA